MKKDNENERKLVNPGPRRRTLYSNHHSSPYYPLLHFPSHSLPSLIPSSVSFSPDLLSISFVHTPFSVLFLTFLRLCFPPWHFSSLLLVRETPEMPLQFRWFSYKNIQLIENSVEATENFTPSTRAKLLLKGIKTTHKDKISGLHGHWQVN